MNVLLVGGIHDGAEFPLMDGYDEPPGLLHVFKCPHCDELHHAAPDEYAQFIEWQESEDPGNEPKDEELYTLREVQLAVAVYEVIGLALPTESEDRDLAHA